MSFIAGHYVCLHNTVTIGQLKDGWTGHTVTYKELIQGDNLARGAQDAVFQGIDMTSDFTLMEWDLAQCKLLFWPYGSGTWLTCGVVGRLDVQQSLAKAFKLTAVAGPPAAANPATLTMDLSILHEDFPVDHIFAPKHRLVPIRLRHYPTISSNGTSVVYGTAT